MKYEMEIASAGRRAARTGGENLFSPPRGRAAVRDVTASTAWGSFASPAVEAGDGSDAETSDSSTTAAGVASEGSEDTAVEGTVEKITISYP